MVIKHEEWKKILSAVNEKEDRSKDNVIDKIKEELRACPQTKEYVLILHSTWGKDEKKVSNRFKR